MRGLPSLFRTLTLKRPPKDPGWLGALENWCPAFARKTRPKMRPHPGQAHTRALLYILDWRIVEDAAFPSNSRKPQEEKKIEKVVVGEVIQRKPGLARRFRETFGGGDAKSVGSYIFLEVFIPALKDTIADMVSQGVERMIFGEARSSSRRTGNRPSSIVGHVAYNRYATPPWKRDRDERDDRRPSPRASSSSKYEDIVLATRVEAETVIDRMFDMLNQYEQVTVGDLYELVGIPGTFTDQKWGWLDLRGAGPQRVRDGYLLDLPRPVQLD